MTAPSLPLAHQQLSQYICAKSFNNSLTGLLEPQILDILSEQLIYLLLLGCEEILQIKKNLTTPHTHVLLIFLCFNVVFMLTFSSLRGGPLCAGRGDVLF